MKNTKIFTNEKKILKGLKVLTESETFSIFGGCCEKEGSCEKECKCCGCNKNSENKKSCENCNCKAAQSK